MHRVMEQCSVFEQGYMFFSVSDVRRIFKTGIKDTLLSTAVCLIPSPDHQRTRYIVQRANVVSDDAKVVPENLFNDATFDVVRCASETDLDAIVL